MIFSGMEFMKKPPFKDVYIHATVLTREGKRMSKSLGTGIDPIELIKKYGADATRFGIAFQVMGSQDIRFIEDNIVMGKKFCNKIWNASRFVLMQISQINQLIQWSRFDIGQLTSADKKILKELNTIIKSVNKDLENFRFGKVAHKLYDFFWHDFCDRYIEESKKPRKNLSEILRGRQVLLYVLLNTLKLLHPFIPFITEEIYQKLPIYPPKFSKGKLGRVKNKKKFLMIEDWPK
jgi:valyl-tRNA synthetase